MNKLFITGNLTRDPELRSTRDGTPVCTFTVAVSRRQKSAEAGKPDADFFRVTAWRALGESCGKYLQKGRKVGVTGSVSVNTYTAQDGSFRASMEVAADDVEFLSPKSEYAPGTVGAIDAAAKKDQQTGFVQVDGDELPF
jgi:single-strand DNA-binding protein